MFEQRERFGAGYRCLEQSLVQVPTRLRIPLEAQTGCLCWEPDHVPDPTSCRRLKFVSSAEGCEFDQFGKLLAMGVEIAAQRRDNKDPFAASQSTESGDIFPLEHRGNPCKQLLQLIYNERKVHLRFYPSQPLRCDGCLGVLKPGRKPDTGTIQLVPGEPIQHLRYPDRGTAPLFSYLGS